MPPGIELASAQIIPFPIRSGRRKHEAGKVATEKINPVAAAALDTCWYHDEAVRETTPPVARD